MIENLLQTLVGFADTLFVARIGLKAVTAVGAANALLAVYIAVFMAVGIGTSSLIAKSIGSGNLSVARDAARQSTIVALYSGIFTGLVTVFAASGLLVLMGTQASIRDDSMIYLQIVAIPSVIIALMIHFGNVLRASGDTRTPMLISVIVNLIHLLFDYLLIFGWDGFQGFGVPGAAYATVLARLIGVLLLWHFIHRSAIRFSWFQASKKSDRVIRLDIIRLSLPAAAERLIMRLGQVVYLGMILRMGTEIYAANLIAENIETFAYLPGLGLSVAATILVGRSLGAGQPQSAKNIGYQAVIVGIVIMSLSGVLLYFGTPVVANWFTDNVPAQQMITLAMRIDAFFMPPLAVGLVLAGALQGSGDTKSPMYSTALGMWGIRVIFIYLLGLQLHLGIAGIWIAQGIDLTFKALFLHLRYKKFFHLKVSTARSLR